MKVLKKATLKGERCERRDSVGGQIDRQGGKSQFGGDRLSGRDPGTEFESISGDLCETMAIVKRQCGDIA